MPEHNIEQKIDHLIKLVEGLAETTTRQFDQVHQQFDGVNQRLDRIEFRLTGQDQRISVLEDRMRQIATKVGMEFGR